MKVTTQSVVPGADDPSASSRRSFPPSAGRGGIHLAGVTFRYPRADVLAGATLDVPRGGTCVVTGSNASGKSTLLYVCAGLLPVQGGTVTIGGQRPNPVRPSDLVRRGIRCGFVFQEGGLLANMNALANVALPLRYHADLLGITLAEVEVRARAALDRVRVTDRSIYDLPAHLSFGVRKRVALARAIAISPNFFFFDDPDVGLDPKTAALVHEILCGFRDDPEVTMLVATNRDVLVDRLGVPGMILSGGRLVPRHETPMSLPPPPRIA
ncbi:MAG: ATP-binding cassette domain-containing protein [Deltaproteobacteria bacterium]|nr:ATP-binding cassette domain-containing protein [Deltaproteobacteria bacterium]